MTKKVLVTGGAGFIGSHLVDRLVNEGYTVRVLDNLSTGKLKNISGHLSAGNVEFVQGDICDAELVRKTLKDINHVVHLAAVTSVPFSVENPDFTFDVNVRGTLNLLNSSIQEHVSRFVFASSCAVFGDPAVLPANEETPTSPISPYAQSKLLAERYLIGFSERQLLQSVALRFFNVYGPRQGMNEYSGVITRFIDRSKQGLPLTIYGDGSQTRDFVSVHDIVSAIILALNCREATGQIFTIGSGRKTSIEELAKTILELAGVDLEIRHENYRAGDIKDSYGDISKAKRLLGFEPRVSLHDGLRALIKEEHLASQFGCNSREP